MSVAARVVVFHIFKATELGLCDKRETIAARIIIRWPGLEGQDIRLSILQIAKVSKEHCEGRWPDAEQRWALTKRALRTYLAGSFRQGLVQPDHLLLALLRGQLEHGNANNFSGHDCGDVLGMCCRFGIVLGGD